MQSNERTDEYSVHENPLLLLRRIAASIRAPGVVPEDFVVGVKLNVADYVDTERAKLDTEQAAKNDAQHERALAHVREIGSWGTIDFIEVSGGDYENIGESSRGHTSSHVVGFDNGNISLYVG